MKYIKTYEDRYLSDKEIESAYDNFTVTYFKVDSLFGDGGASGSIEIEFADSDGNTQYDNWIKYDAGEKIAFDHWYPSAVNIKLKEIINKGIKEEELRQDAKKYNL